MPEIVPALLALLSTGAGASVAAYLLRRAFNDEIQERVDRAVKTSAAVRAIVDDAIEKERTLLSTRFATREDFARIEGKLDVLVARLGRHE